MYTWVPCFSDSLWAAGDEAVGGWKEPSFRYDGGATNMPIGQEVKANLPGPLAHLSILPSNNSVQLVRPSATVWNSMIKDKDWWERKK